MAWIRPSLAYLQLRESACAGIRSDGAAKAGGGSRGAGAGATARVHAGGFTITGKGVCRLNPQLARVTIEKMDVRISSAKRLVQQSLMSVFGRH